MIVPRWVAALAASAIAVGMLAAAPPVSATPHHHHDKQQTLARELVGPLSLAVEGRDVYVTQNFAGVLNKLRPGGAPRTLYASSDGNEVGGVSVRKGRVVFTETANDEEGFPADSWLKRLSRSGQARNLAHVWAYEVANNPDGVITYGVRGISEECAAVWPTDEIGPPEYSGVVDSHPYATYQSKHAIYVADAGMNAVLKVSDSGRIRTVAVTPEVPVPITEELASALGVPECAVGMTYYGESVPTDVARGPDGGLYVTTEGGGLGEQIPLGSVYRIDPRSGRTLKIVGNLMTPTGIAITPRGDIYVAELFAGQISKVQRGSGTAQPRIAVGLPGAVEFEAGSLFATIDVLPPDEGPPDGKVVRFR